MATEKNSKISCDEFNAMLKTDLPAVAGMGIYLCDIEFGCAEMVLPYHQNSLRPGGTISGPYMMTLADVCMFAVVLGQLGDVKLAVTTNLNINFLRKPAESDLIAKGKMLKLGKRLAVVEVSIFSEQALVAHATGTYSIPPRESAN
ncbi:MAG: PaaI family thioesterase [Pseudomonadota bacterium]